jgi:hypothetical protein
LRSRCGGDTIGRSGGDTIGRSGSDTVGRSGSDGSSNGSSSHLWGVNLLQSSIHPINNTDNNDDNDMRCDDNGGSRITIGSTWSAFLCDLRNFTEKARTLSEKIMVTKKCILIFGELENLTFNKALFSVKKPFTNMSIILPKSVTKNICVSVNKSLFRFSSFAVNSPQGRFRRIPSFCCLYGKHNREYIHESFARKVGDHDLP